MLRTSSRCLLYCLLPPSYPYFQITYNPDIEKQDVFCHLLAIPSKDRLESVLKYLLDENEFLAPYGIRSLSRYHCDHPFVMKVEGEEYCVQYVPAESNTYLFGGNSNWRGPIWLCGQCSVDTTYSAPMATCSMGGACPSTC